MLPPIFFRALRLFLGLIWLVLLSPAQAFPALADHEQLFQTANGQQITPSDLLDTLNQADVSLRYDVIVFSCNWSINLLFIFININNLISYS